MQMISFAKFLSIRRPTKESADFGRRLIRSKVAGDDDAAGSCSRTADSAAAGIGLERQPAPAPFVQRSGLELSTAAAAVANLKRGKS